MRTVPTISLGTIVRQDQLGPYRLVEATYAPDTRLAPHAHEHGYISFVWAGAMKEHVGGCDRALGPGSVIIRRPGETHGDTYGPTGTRLTIVKVPLPGDTAPGDTARHDRLPAIERSVTIESGPVCAAALQCISRVHAEVPAQATSDVIEAIDEDVLRIIDLAAVGRPGTNTRARPAWVDQARDFIHDTIGGPFTVAGLARQIGVHQTDLSRTFRRFHGSTICSYRRRLRVVRAAELLRSGTVSIAQIAVELGFSDQAHLTRELRREIGTTPARLRADCGLVRRAR